jgi:hypothetical protein
MATPLLWTKGSLEILRDPAPVSGKVPLSGVLDQDDILTSTVTAENDAVRAFLPGESSLRGGREPAAMIRG